MWHLQHVKYLGTLSLIPWEPVILGRAVRSDLIFQRSLDYRETEVNEPN